MLIQLRKIKDTILPPTEGKGVILQPHDARDFQFADMYGPSMSLNAVFGPTLKIVDNNEACSEVHSQGSTNSCTGHAGAVAFEYLYRLFSNDPTFQVSARFLYYNARKLAGGSMSDNGAWLRNIIKAAVTYGLASEAECPWSISAVNVAPSAAAYAAAANRKFKGFYAALKTEAEVDAALAKRHAVIGAFTCYSKALYNARYTGDLLYPAAGDTETGLHAMALFGLNNHPGKDHYDDMNSWGTTWGRPDRKGWCRIKKDYLRRGKFHDLWALGYAA